MDFLLIALIGLFSGTIKGSSGFGSSLVALPLLVFFYPVSEVVVMMITINVLVNFIMLFENKGFSLKYIKEIKFIILFGVIFTYIGLLLLNDIDEQLIKYFAATLILIAVLNKLSLLKFKINDTILFQSISGALSGFSNGIASIDGPPVVFYLTSIKADKLKFKKTLVTYFLFLGVISVLMLSFDGAYSLEILKNTGFLSIFIILGVLFGMKASSKIDEAKFSKYVTILLIILGISMLI